jgi:hypothetical protein
VKPSVSSQMKEDIFKRDDFTCVYCGKKYPPDQLVLDHRIPLSEGGSDDSDNLATSCLQCHLKKADKVLDEYVRAAEAESRAKRAWSWMAIVITTVALVASVIVVFTGDRPRSSLQLKMESRLTDLSRSLGEQQKELTRIAREVQSLSKPTNRMETALLNQKIEDVSSRLREIETSISEDPAKALSIPLLRQDVAHVKESVSTGLVEVRREVDKIHDQTKWLIGLIITMLVSLMGLAMTTLLSTKKKPK